MIETAAPDSGGPDIAAAPADEEGRTAGAMLQRAREAAGLHVAALAVSLKVPVRKLEALEADRYEQLSDAVFVRALASSVCRTLKIDPQPVLDRLPQSAAPRLMHDTDGLNAPFHGPRDGAAPNWPEQLSKPVVLAVFGLLLGALVLIFLPRAPVEEQSPAETRTVEVPSPEAQGPAEPAAAPAAPPAAAMASAAAPATNVVPASPPVAATAAATNVVPAPAAATAAATNVVPAPAAATAAAATVPVAPAPAAAPTSAPAAVAAGAIVAFRTRQSSWVEVTDAKGTVAFRKLMAAGESGAASGALPLKVTVGRVDATDVQVRGKPLDLRPMARDNVARFEVK